MSQRSKRERQARVNAAIRDTGEQMVQEDLHFFPFNSRDRHGAQRGRRR